MARDYEQGDLFYSAGQYGKCFYPKLTQLKRKEKIRGGGGGDESEWTGKVEIRTRKKAYMTDPDLYSPSRL